MTNGSSQGLFVVVAVVIFGIFVAISYSLFRDQLSPSLASIFSDATSFAQESLVPFNSIEKYSGEYAEIISDKNGEIQLERVDSDYDSSYANPFGLRLNVSDATIPWGYKMVFQYEVFVVGENDFIVSSDFNTYPVEGNSWRTSDNFGTMNSGNELSSMFVGEKIAGNTWNKITVWYANDNKDNEKKVNISEKSGPGTAIGIQRKDAKLKNVNIIKFRNLKYKVVKM